MNLQSSIPQTNGELTTEQVQQEPAEHLKEWREVAGDEELKEWVRKAQKAAEEAAEETERLIHQMNECLEEGKAPRQLVKAVGILDELRFFRMEFLADGSNRDVTKNYQAVVASFKVARAVLDELDAWAKVALATGAFWHLKCLDEIKALGDIQK